MKISAATSVRMMIVTTAHNEEDDGGLAVAQHELHQAPYRDEDQRHRGGADPVEQRLHPRQALEGRIQRRDHGDQHERREDEGDGAERGAEHAAADVPDPHGKLRGKGAGHRLGHRHALDELALADPPALLHQVVAHLADQRHGAPKPQRAEAQIVAGEIPDRRRARVGRRGLLGHGTLP